MKMYLGFPNDVADMIQMWRDRGASEDACAAVGGYRSAPLSGRTSGRVRPVQAEGVTRARQFGLWRLLAGSSNGLNPDVRMVASQRP